MRVFALGWFFDFILLGVLVARFAHIIGTSKDCSWFFGGVGGRWVGLHMVVPIVMLRGLSQLCSGGCASLYVL